MVQEPTNHLDMETIDVLIEALKEFKGAVVSFEYPREICDSTFIRNR